MAFGSTMTRKLREHSRLSSEDVSALSLLPSIERDFSPGEDIVQQDQEPRHSIVVLDGMVGRYHVLRGGRRQYISFHISGELPDLQALFLSVMDHGLCAIGAAKVALLPHAPLLRLLEQRHRLMAALWRETLIDAAVFRAAITNNSARPLRARVAHFLSERYYRAQTVGQVRDGACPFPLKQSHLAEALGVSLVSANRAMSSLRRSGICESRAGLLHVYDWAALASAGEFDPSYLHLRKPPQF